MEDQYKIAEIQFPDSEIFKGEGNEHQDYLVVIGNLLDCEGGIQTCDIGCKLERGV